jgi:hypothetical protein
MPWTGEEGPELPGAYNVTMMHAMPRDPHWAYAYWDISEEDRSQLMQQEGEWIFDITSPMIRVWNGGDLVQEIPVLLDAQSWYLNLTPNQRYQFELGLKRGGEDFITLSRSNPVHMPAEGPSHEADEEWAVVDETYEELMRVSGGLDMPSSGHVSMAPHILRHRKRLPWKVPSMHELPTSGMWSGVHVSSHLHVGSHTPYKTEEEKE